MPNEIIQFYSLEKPDSEGRMLTEYWAWDHNTLEHRHDFIQWMFPLDEPSAVNPDAPLLTEEDKAEFRRDPLLRSSLDRSLAVFLSFLGLTTRQGGEVGKGSNFAQRIYVWTSCNHNWLRVTRLLKSLLLLGFQQEAKAIWLCLKKLHEEDGYVSENSFQYWAEAAEGLDAG